MWLYNHLHRRFGPRDGLTRREMLARSLAAGAGLLLSNQLPFGRLEAAAGRVIVVGAGFSGLAAAHELHAAGYDVTVVEARNRIGGRVLSFSDLVPGKNVEGGAELIGSNHPAWVAYREKFKLEFLDVTEEDDLEAPIMLGGRRLSDGEAKALWEDIAELEKVFRGIRASFIRARYMDWPGDPWVRASYSFPRPDRSQPSGRRSSMALAACTLPASTPLSRFPALWRERSTPARVSRANSRNGMAWRQPVDLLRKRRLFDLAVTLFAQATAAR